MAEERDRGAGLVVGAVGGTVLGALGVTIYALLAKAAEAKELPPEDKLNYLIECQTAIVQLLGQLVEGNQAIIGLLQQLVAAAGVPPAEGIEVIVKTPWVAKEPEEIFREPITSADTFYSRIVNWTEGKRLVIKVESTLNQAVQIQVIGNIIESVTKATDIGPPLPCAANSNISVGPAWDDWHPFIGVRITTAVAPTAGILKIDAVIQE
ncbi:hypothetical protein ES703_90677 [subsurface metagenome]